MSKRLRFDAYKNSSRGLKNVIEKLKDNHNIVAKMLKKQNSKFVPRAGDVVIPWGTSKEESGKIYQYRKFQEASVPCADWTQDKEVAKTWIQEGKKVLCRTLLNASNGRGITIARTEDQLIDAPLYVKYRAKKREFRIHVVFGIAGTNTYMVEKKKRLEHEGGEQLIRNHDNGWVFCHDFEHPEQLVMEKILNAAADAVAALNLPFGAVDLGLSKNGDVTVYEVNSAPGVENSTAAWYAEQFARMIVE